MEKTLPKFKKYIFVCVNLRDNGDQACGAPGQEIRDRLKAYVKEKRLSGQIRVSQTGCLDVCSQGPNVIVYPDNVWYSRVTLQDLPRIIEEQIRPFEKGVSPAA